MRKVTRSYKKRIINIASVIAACLFMCFAVSLIQYGRSSVHAGSYAVKLNGNLIGITGNTQAAEAAIKEAKQKIAEESVSIVFSEINVEFEELKDKESVSDSDENELETAIYNALKNEKENISNGKPAYEVKIGELTVTLSSKEEVIQLLEKAKENYDTDHTFSVDLVENSDGQTVSWIPNIEKTEIEPNLNNAIFASMDTITVPDVIEMDKEESEESEKKDNEILSLEFSEDIEVMETYVDGDSIDNLESAVKLVTDTRKAESVYEVQDGDCLFSISREYNLTVPELLTMNDNLSIDSVLEIGDEVNVTVPKKELSVVVKKEEIYEEDYKADIVYVENDSMYEDDEKVIDRGQAGYIEVTAVVESVNGTEINREILEETVIKEAKPKVIEIGTLAKPTFIRPIIGGITTSGFGARWGETHLGHDWGISTGTAVMASREGVVLSSEWNNSYGYNILVEHNDGTQTRYAHLSELLVSKDDIVTQGQKIALSGNTGNSTGPHLHFEVIVDGNQVDPLDYVSEY